MTGQKYGLRDYTSRNPESGLLESITEVRDLGLFFASELLALLQAPAVMLTMPPGEWGDIVAGICALMSMLERTTEAGLYRNTMHYLGASDEDIEKGLKRYPQLSEERVYDPESPALGVQDLPDIDLDSVVFQTSPLLQELYKQKQAGAAPLSSSVEDYLKRLEGL